MIRVHYQLMICRGHIRASKDALQIFLWLTVLYENWHFSQMLHFVFILAAILKGHKWVRKSKIISVVNLNMVYQIPVWKPETFYMGTHRSKIHVLFWSKSKKCYFLWDNPHLHTKPNLNKCRKVQRSQIFKQNWIILICSSFIAYLMIWTIPALVGGWEWVWVCLGMPPTCPYIHAHAHVCMHMHNTNIYMYSNCKWPPPWRHPCLSCITCMCVCASVHACMHMCACMGHPYTPTSPIPKGVTPQIS